MNRNSWSIAGLIVVVFLTLPAFVGCSAFQNRAVVQVDEAALADDERVVLSWQVRSDAFSRSQSLSLRLDDAGQGQAYETRVVADVDKEDLALRVDPEHRRAWVLDRRQNAVLLSVDFQNERIWKESDDQPSWALTE